MRCNHSKHRLDKIIYFNHNLFKILSSHWCSSIFFLIRMFYSLFVRTIHLSGLSYVLFGSLSTLSRRPRAYGHNVSACLSVCVATLNGWYHKTSSNLTIWSKKPNRFFFISYAGFLIAPGYLSQPGWYQIKIQLVDPLGLAWPGPKPITKFPLRHPPPPTHRNF